MFRAFVPTVFSALVLVPLYAAGQSAQSAPAAPQQPETKLHANADLVLVDVTVNDARQNPVQHLTAADFTVLEDGKPQTVKVFEEHAAGPPSPLPPAPKFRPGTFTNFSGAPETGALNILLFDKLNTPMDAQTAVRDQVLKYLKEAPPGTRTAIFSLTTELKLLQGFTSDPELLRALVESKKGSQGASPLMNNAMEGDQPGADDPMMDTMTDALGNDPDAATILANLQQFEAEMQSFQIQLRQKYTLDALNQLARYMSNLPGRKNLIWFSGSFPITILPDPDLENASAPGSKSGAFTPNPFAVVASAADEFKETVAMLSRSQVAVYPIDARGLMVAPMLSATQSGSTMNRKPNGFGNAYSKWLTNTASEQGTMQQMAEATGGKAYVNTNDLKQAIEKAIETGSNYYTVAYTPDNRNWNGAFRKIQVKVDRPSVNLAYRRGYYADDPLGPEHRNAAQTAKADATDYSALRTAMMRGGPDPTELIFVASVRPSSADAEPAIVESNQASKKISGPYRRYSVIFVTNPREVNWTPTPDGVHHCMLEFLTFVYDADGKLVNMQTNSVSANIGADKFSALLKQNLQYQQQISVPVKGEYYLRLGMRDAGTDRVGALELPVEAVAKLPPLAAEGTAPAAPK